MIKLHIKLFATIRLDIGFGETHIESPKAIDIIEMLTIVSAKINFDLIDKLLENGKMIPGVIILVDGKNIYHLSNLETVIDKDSTIAIFPAAAGG